MKLKKKIRYRVCKLKGCSEKYEVDPNKPLFPCCSIDHAYKYSLFLKEKKQIRNNIQEKREVAVLKESLKTNSDYKKILQILINKIVRLIDKDCPCIATGKHEGKMNAGHYISVGSNDTLRFHLDNIHIQSEHSNSHRGGDTIRYQKGLMRVYGKEYFEYVDSLQSTAPIKLSIPELKEKIKIAKEIVKELEEHNCIYDTESRIKIRAYYNQQLGIY